MVDGRKAVSHGCIATKNTIHTDVTMTFKVLIISMIVIGVAGIVYELIFGKKPSGKCMNTGEAARIERGAIAQRRQVHIDRARQNNDPGDQKH